MRIATTVFLTDESVRPARLARELEQRGFAGLYLPEHTHIPVSRDTAAPMGEPLPRQYGRTLDPFVALAQAAAVTEQLGVGTGITLVAQHDPVSLAKRVATLDHLSDGRLTFGIGYGWNVEEAADHNVSWPDRRDLVQDRMALMRALWAPEPTAYRGRFGSVRASLAHPKPVRRRSAADPLTGPRTLIGGAAGPKLFAHVAAYADGWMPTGGGGLTEAIPVLRRVWEEAGRDPAALEVVPYAVLPSPGKLAHYADLGIEEAVVQLPAPEPGMSGAAHGTEILRTLDAYAQYL
ncbi:TIGR03619 family F420-dependent LLM class oxidoreductase [Streptomyces sp. NA02950]|uniref:TIGR03619 family F420-dependent LLM class oxidoreductase n=1 Tax=Streptomyces sp. NA02950 TaxID=2742137 RepID=UPI001591765D|nr:TIGR03619 family F420-dependent LLM class oxidoreductase [Streptomyces sp. NA02950]QKV93138.1 TIGR03619 family F420-dependent LLM class oxidoreductase [Streptomyces sp. NA02950]